MKKRLAIKLIAVCALFTVASGQFGIANAQTKLKWAHVYETKQGLQLGTVDIILTGASLLHARSRAWPSATTHSPGSSV